MQVLAGLRYAHEHGVVHRDVKPHNVLVGDDGRIKVTDFGIAHAGDPQMTEVGSIVGTAQYLSPEQARGRTVGPQTDIYSLGVVLYEMLTGRVPFEGDSSVAIAMQHVSDEPPPLRSLAPLVPESLAMVVAHAMLKEPTQRYASADEFAADLDRVRRGLVPVAATAMMAASRTSRPSSSPAAEATRIAPRAAGDAAPERREAAPRPDAGQALALAVAARAAARARRRARSRRSRSAWARATAVADDDGTTGTTTADDDGRHEPQARGSDGQVVLRGVRRAQRLRAASAPQEPARARQLGRGRRRRRERPGRRADCCTTATRCC